MLAADACAGHGLDVPQLTPATSEALAAFLPPGAAVQNPIDMIASASAETYGRTLDMLLAGDEIDSVLVIFTPPLVTRSDDVAAAVLSTAESAVRAGHSKPVLASFLGAEGAPSALRSEIVTVPCFTYPESAARALERAVAHAEWLNRPLGTISVVDNVDTNAARRLLETPPEDGWLTAERAMVILKEYGIPVAATVPVTSADEAESAASEIGFPVVLKATGPGLVHKSDVGGVRLSLDSTRAVGTAYGEMADKLGDAMTGAIVQPMAHEGLEVIVGFVQDPAFGPLVLFGLGGTAVELLGDYATCRVPLTDVDAREMVLSIRSAPLLTGYRGSTPVDIDALVDVVMRCGRLAEDLIELSEADLNPVIAGPDGVVVVDARFHVSPESFQPEETRQLM